VLKESVLLKGTASAVPQATHLQRGFSRRGTLFAMEGPLSAPPEGPLHSLRKTALFVFPPFPTGDFLSSPLDTNGRIRTAEERRVRLYSRTLPVL